MIASREIFNFPPQQQLDLPAAVTMKINVDPSLVNRVGDNGTYGVVTKILLQYDKLYVLIILVFTSDSGLFGFYKTSFLGKSTDATTEVAKIATITPSATPIGIVITLDNNIFIPMKNKSAARPYCR